MKICQYNFKWLAIVIGILAALNSSATEKNNDGDYRSFTVEVLGEGQPMILIHGINSDADVWDSTINKFKPNYEIHVVQIKGFAGTPAFEYGDSFLPKVKDDLINYIQESKLKNVILVGHSMGGFLSLWVASESDDLIAGTIIVDSLPFMPAMVNPNSTEENMKPMAEQIKQQIAAQTPASIRASASVYLAPMVGSEEDLNTITEWSASSDQITSAQAMYELFTIDLRQEIAHIKSPTLVLASWIGNKNYGATHESTATNYDAQYKAIAHVEIVITDEGKHFIMWDDEEFYFQYLEDFLAHTLSSNE